MTVVRQFTALRPGGVVAWLIAGPRRAMTERPRLAMQWTIDPQTGRPVAAWQVEAPTVLPTASLVSELA
jgi:hypothetical protein